MNFKKINKQLNKVKNLIDNIAEDDHVSPIEQHLLQSYIRDLYELTLSKEVVGKQKVNLTVMDEVEDVAPVVQVRKTTQIIEPTPVVVAPPKVTPPPPPVPTPAPVATPAPVESIVATPVPTPVATPAPTPAPVVTPVAPVVVAAPIVTPPVTPTSSKGMSTEMKELFSESKMSELSDRLSMMPLKDLTKSMGINEKIFTIQELFAGSQAKFDSVMGHLNGLSSYDQAKEYLSGGIASELNWTNEDKMRKAQKLITLIKRRYL